MLQMGMCYQSADGRWLKFQGCDAGGTKRWLVVINPPPYVRSAVSFESVR